MITFVHGDDIVTIDLNKTYLGIELGSTRIKAVLSDENLNPLAMGSYTWENRLENGIWTYSLEDIKTGLQSCFADLSKDVSSKYNVEFSTCGAMGISAMMHGYMAFDENDNLLVPFRTWRNTITSQAADELTKALGFNIPQRWTCAHLYQAVLSKEKHIDNISYVTTLAGYVHYILTGEKVVGIGEASGIFPVLKNNYNPEMTAKYESLLCEKGFDKKILRIFPEVRLAGEHGGILTESGAKFLDPTGVFKAGVALCPPEGDAGTGMTAANAVRPGTGNVSGGTSIFSMLVLDNDLKGVYPEIDMVTTPHGAPVAMVHCNNCCSELDVWVNIFDEFCTLMGISADKSELYQKLYLNAMKGDTDCGKVISYNFLSGEPVAYVDKGRPTYFRLPEGKMNLSNFMRSQLYSSMAALKMGMDILFENEYVKALQFTAHGGLFKVQGAAQQILSDALNTPVSVMKTAGEGGAWGMSILAAYMADGGKEELPDWLENKVFANMKKQTVTPLKDGVKGFDDYMKLYKTGLSAQRKLEEVK